MSFKKPLATIFDDKNYGVSYLRELSDNIMTEVSEDTSPTLGGDLDGNGKNITNVVNLTTTGDITVGDDIIGTPTGYGKLLATASYTTYSSTTSVFSNPPTSAQGISIFSQSITTTQDNSVVEILANSPVNSASAANQACIALFNDSTNLNLTRVHISAAGGTTAMPMVHYFIPGTAGTYTINLRFGVANGNVGTVYINGTNAAAMTNSTTVLIIKEYFV